MSPKEGVLYTPDEVAENGWLGSDTTASALRKAAGRKPGRGRIEHTRFQGRIYFTAANIRSIQERGFEPADTSQQPNRPARRGRRTVAAVPDLPTGAQPLVARPNAARRRRAAS